MNLAVILIDSLRADRLSCYGYGRATSPFMDALCESAVLFENFFTPITPTQPACTSLFTGQFPITHRIVAQSGKNTLDAKAPWFPEILARHGFATAAVDCLRDEKRWFGRGFQTTISCRTPSGDYLDCFAKNQEAIAWLQRTKRRPFLLYLRYGETHTPYCSDRNYQRLFYEGDDPTTRNRGSLDAFYARPLKPPLVTDWLLPMAAAWPGAAGCRIEDIEFVRAQYDAGVRMADDGVQHFMEELQKLKLADETAVIILGDHGQALGEHGIYFEHHGLYESTLRPPLIVHWPAARGNARRIKQLVQLPDVAPTLLEMVGLGVPDSMEGKSLVPWLHGLEAPGPYSYILAAECTWMAKWAFRKCGYKLIVARQPDFYGKPPFELYHLDTDPREQTNLAYVEPQLRDTLAHELEDCIQHKLAMHGEQVDPIAAHGTVRGRSIVTPRPTLLNRISRGLPHWLPGLARRRSRPVRI